MRRLRIHHRIVLPLWLAATATAVVGAYVALSFISRTLETRVEAQVLGASAVISRSDFALNASILSSVKAITGAELVTFTLDGRVLATTVDPREGATLVAAVNGPGARRALATGDRTYAVREVFRGQPWFVVYRPLARRAGAVVAFAADLSEVASVTGAITRMVLAGVALSVVAILLVTHLVARRITMPIEELVAFAREVESGPGGRRAAAGDDEVGRLGGAFNDMLDRLDRSQASLLRSEKLGLAGLMAARVAHDVRNPLSSIKMHAQLLRQHLRAADDAALADAVLRDVGQVESVVRDLLAVARPGDLHLRETRLNDVVREVLQQMTPQLAHRHIGVRTTLDEDVPTVRLDVSRFGQALTNVLVNAADAMHAGGTLEVATRRADDGATILLEVCDTGVGVDPALLDRVFEPFVSTKPDGVGLGLVNAKAVVESHGGRIALAPRVPAGTRVSIRLPAAAARAGSRETTHG